MPFNSAAIKNLKIKLRNKMGIQVIALLIILIAVAFMFFSMFIMPLPDKVQPSSLTTNQVLKSNPTETFVVSTPTLTHTDHFQLKDGILLVTTKLMNVKIENGAVIYIRDNISGEVLVNSNVGTNLPSDTDNFIGFTVKAPVGLQYTVAPEKSISDVSLENVSPNVARLIYLSLGNRPTNKSRLTINILVDETSGEIVLQLTGEEPNSGSEILSANLPIMNISTDSVILGSGAQFFRNDPAEVDQTTYVKYGLYSPSMAVIQNSQSVAAIWSESTNFDPEYIQLIHKPGSDHLVAHSERSALQDDPQKIISPAWRIGTYRTWVEAARRWREKFEERTGAKPLWENRVPWVRNVHAVFDSTDQEYGSNQQQYINLAGKTPPEKTLFFLWNGDRIVLFGDHTLVEKVTRPSPEAVKIIKSYGWPLVLYYPYTLINSEKGAADRLQSLKSKGWLPANYQFNPDYPGDAKGWQQYWADVKTNYEDGSRDYVIHPGSNKFKEYIVHNFGNYMSKYQANGAYFDILGANEEYLFEYDKKIIEGQNYVQGEVNVIKLLGNDFPKLAIMSEYQSPWLIPYVFFSWEGSATHIPQNTYAKTRINHPLRVALLGSYLWGRESNEDGTDGVISALFGTLPQVSMQGDSGISDEQALWSQARAKLFCDEELFNDLPEKWDVSAIAYYRSMRTGHWFKFEHVGNSYGYIEIMEDGKEVTRLVK